VWDAGLVALDVVLPPGHPLAPADVVETYRWLGEAVAEALAELGLEHVEVAEIARARSASAAPGEAAAACFGGLSPFEVLVDGRKVLGLSQARRRPGTLLQAGLLLDLDADGLARLMGRGATFARALAAAAAGLREWRADLAAADLVSAVERAVSSATGATVQADEPNGAERAQIAAALAAGVGPSPVRRR
jgi:lipoate---protein ligase